MGFGVMSVSSGSGGSFAGCEEKEKEKEKEGGRGIALDREDSRSAMWPNRDRPSEL